MRINWCVCSSVISWTTMVDISFLTMVHPPKREKESYDCWLICTKKKKHRTKDFQFISADNIYSNEQVVCRECCVHKRNWICLQPWIKFLNWIATYICTVCIDLSQTFVFPWEPIRMHTKKSFKPNLTHLSFPPASAILSLSSALRINCVGTWHGHNRWSFVRPSVSNSNSINLDRAEPYSCRIINPDLSFVKFRSDRLFCLGFQTI